MSGFPESLQADRLMQHMKVLCKEIGPRPSASTLERQAAEYVKRILAQIGAIGVQEQPFKTHTTLSLVALPLTVIALISTVVAWFGGRRAKLVSGLLWLQEMFNLRGFMLAKPPFFQRLVAQANSQNVIATIPARGNPKRKLYLIGHLDTNKQRFSAPPPMPGLMRLMLTCSLVLSGVLGLSLIWRGIRDKRGLSGLQKFSLLFGLQTIGLALYDETQPHIEGANDNATAVSTLLGIAEALRENPLENTEVTLLFTGCEEVPCAGIEAYLDEYNPAKYNTYWIDLEMVGTGNICYVTGHGISYLTRYSPSPEMLPIAARAATRHPALSIAGKDMLILEEVASLVRRGYKAICVAGYDQAGYLPNWHRVTDTLENIQPETLSRAACYTWAVIQEIDQLA